MLQLFNKIKTKRDTINMLLPKFVKAGFVNLN